MSREQHDDKQGRHLRSKDRATPDKNPGGTEKTKRAVLAIFALALALLLALPAGVAQAGSVTANLVSVNPGIAGLSVTYYDYNQNKLVTDDDMTVGQFNFTLSGELNGSYTGY